MDDYEWATGFFQRRCGVKFRQRFHIYNNGRCDLKRNHDGEIHVLERGMEVFEFKMVGERKLTRVAQYVVEREIWKRSRDV